MIRLRDLPGCLSDFLDLNAVLKYSILVMIPFVVGFGGILLAKGTDTARCIRGSCRAGERSHRHYWRLSGAPRSAAVERAAVVARAVEWVSAGYLVSRTRIRGGRWDCILVIRAVETVLPCGRDAVRSVCWRGERSSRP